MISDTMDESRRVYTYRVKPHRLSYASSITYRVSLIPNNNKSLVDWASELGDDRCLIDSYTLQWSDATEDHSDEKVRAIHFFNEEDLLACELKFGISGV